MNIVRFRFESLSFTSSSRVKIDGYTLYIQAYVYFAHGAYEKNHPPDWGMINCEIENP